MRRMKSEGSPGDLVVVLVVAGAAAYLGVRAFKEFAFPWDVLALVGIVAAGTLLRSLLLGMKRG